MSTGYTSILGSDTSTAFVKRVFCCNHGYAAVAHLSEAHPVYGSYISVFGRPGSGGEFNTSDSQLMSYIRSSG